MLRTVKIENGTEYIIILTEHQINQLKSIEDMLRRYCHAENCKRTEFCPDCHETCSMGLNLSTSIAWEMANIIENYLDIFPRKWKGKNDRRTKSISSKDGWGSIVFLDERSTMASVLRDVVSRHAGSPEVRKICSLIERAQRMLTSLNCEIDYELGRMYDKNPR